MLNLLDVVLDAAADGVSDEGQGEERRKKATESEWA